MHFSTTTTKKKCNNCHNDRMLPLRRWEVWMNPLKKENLCWKYFFRCLMKFLKFVRNDISDVKANKKTTNRRSVGCIYKFL